MNEPKNDIDQFLGHGRRVWTHEEACRRIDVLERLVKHLAERLTDLDGKILINNATPAGLTIDAVKLEPSVPSKKP